MSSLKYGLSVLELCRLLGEIIHISGPQCPHLQDEDTSGCREGEVVHVKTSAQRILTNDGSSLFPYETRLITPRLHLSFWLSIYVPNRQVFVVPFSLLLSLPSLPAFL